MTTKLDEIDDAYFNEIFADTEVHCSGLPECEVCRAIDSCDDLSGTDDRDRLLEIFEEELREEDADKFFAAYDAGAEKYAASNWASGGEFIPENLLDGVLKTLYGGERSDPELADVRKATRGQIVFVRNAKELPANARIIPLVDAYAADARSKGFTVVVEGEAERGRQLESARRMDGYLDYIATPQDDGNVKLSTLKGEVVCVFNNPDLYAEVKAAQDDFNNYLVSISRMEDHRRGVADIERRVDALQQESLCKAYWDTRFAKTPGWLCVAALVAGVVGFFLILFRNA